MLARTIFIAACVTLATGCGGSSEDSSSGGSSGSGGAAASGGSGANGGTGANGGAAGNGGNAGTSPGGNGGAAGNAGNAGTSPGGNAGAAGSGATAGNGGAAGSGGNAGSGPASPECESSTDCNLFSDCCNCVGYPANGDAPGGCDSVCKTDRCDEFGVKAAECVAGRCVAQINCDSSGVLCGTPSPVCPTGEVPIVSGGCWQGGCTPATQCASVTDCGACTGANTACVSYQAQLGPVHHCVEVPDSCAGAATCECFGPSTCVGGFNACSEYSGIKGVICGCPAC